MAFYTLGLTVLSTPVAMASWTPIAPQHLPALLSIGVFAQCAQFCFLRAHRLAEASFLSILGYLSLILSTSVGYFVFDETPAPSFWIGATLILAAASVLRSRKP
jgi:S-adenosylmethionine uptake transporter